MRRALKIIGIIIAILIIVPIVAVLALDIFLNTGTGRHFAAKEINSLSGGTVKITGLSGHFPKYIALNHVAIADRKGTYLTLDHVVLRWSPFALIHRALDVTDLTAQRIDFARLPVPAANKTKKKPKSSFGLPIKSAIIDHLAINRLIIGKPVTGHEIALRIGGHAVATSLTHVSVALHAASLLQPGDYRINATVDPQTIDAKLALHEPAGGMIETLGGISKRPGLNQPLNVTMTIRGPRKNAAFNLASVLGPMRATGTGTIDLSQSSPGADLTITIPELAPYAELGHRKLAGRNVLHLVAKKTGSATSIHINDAVEITNGAKPIPTLVGKRATLVGDFTLDRGTTTIHAFTLDAAAIKAKLAGVVKPSSVALNGTLSEPDINLIDPQLKGHVAETVKLSGPRTDLTLSTIIDGVVTAPGVKSGPFHVAIDMAHLPKTPSGTITGTGSLYGAPLAINADFSHNGQGTTKLDLKTLSWKSLTGQGAVSLASGAKLPDGTLHLAITRLADIGELLNVAASGSITADFNHQSGQPAHLIVAAKGVHEGKSVAVDKVLVDASLDHVDTDPAIDATATISGLRAPSAAGGLKLTAKGTETSLAIAAQGMFSNLGGKPAKLDLAGTVDGKTRVVQLSSLTAAARGVTARLLSPATIIAKPGLAVRNLTLALGGLGGKAQISADGTIRPSLDLTAKITDLPASIAKAADPKLSAHGMVNATAHVTGTLSAPTGTVTLDAKNLGVTRGPGAKLPAANITANETLLGHAMRGSIAATLGAARLNVDGTAPLSMTGTMALTARLSHVSASLVHAVDPKIDAHGTIDADAKLSGTPRDPHGTINLTGRNLGVTRGPGAKLPAANITAKETLMGRTMRGSIAASLGAARLNLDGTTPLSMTGPMALTARLSNVSANLVHAVDPKLDARGTINANAKLSGTPRAPRGTIDLTARGMRLLNGPSASLPAANLTAHETLAGTTAQGTIHLTVGKRADLTVNGTAPLAKSGRFNLAVTGKTDLRIANPITEAEGTRVTGTLSPDLHISGTMASPQASGRVTLTDASVQNIGSGLDLTKINALLTGTGQTVTLDRLSATAGNGTITGHGSIGLQQPMPIDIHIAFNNASPISSDIITEKLGGGVSITGAVKSGLKIGGTVDINSANIQIPKGLPPSVAKLNIIRPGVKVPPPPAPSAPIALALNVVAKNQVFIRGDGIFANLGGHLRLSGTSAQPVPSGGFYLIRGHFDLGGKNLQFTKGTIRFNTGGFMPTIDLEATSTASDGTVSTLAVTGTPTAPKITLSSSPTLPSDEVLAHILYGTSTQNLSAFQAASLAASLAQLAGIGGSGASPLGGVRKALGLDELSVGGGTSGPTVNAGRYVAPGVYVGAQQSASGGGGSTAKVEINLYKGLKLKTEVSSGGGAGSNSGESIGLAYQFNY